MDPLSNLRGLHARLDAHAAQVRTQHHERLACRVGCTSCCAGERTVTAVEAARLRQALDALPAAVRGALGPRDDGLCPLLDATGACAVYAARPVVCRTHGLPLLDGAALHTCELNFVEPGALEAVSPEHVLAMDTVNTVLAAVDAVYRAHGTPADRVRVGSLL